MKRKIVIVILLMAIFVSNVSAITQSNEIQINQEFSIIHNEMLNVVKYPFNGDYASAAQAGLEQFQAGSMSSEDGKYKIVGQKFVSIKNTNKLTKLIIEQGNASYEKKVLAVGEKWNVGGGWAITAMAIDAGATPRQVWLQLSKGGIVKDDRVLAEGQIYTYVEKSFAGESDVPLFLTYVDSVFAGAYYDLVQLRYTWALSTKPIIIRGK